MADQELIQCSATELVRRLRTGQLSSVELCDAFISRIHEVNPALQALVVDLEESARQSAERADASRRAGEPLGPLHGLPVSIKEMFDVQGTPTTAGITTRRQRLAQQDAPTVSRLRSAGAILLGKTNVPQLGAMAESVNPIYGCSNNPWDDRRSPGGSSGGEAALIAAGGSPLGLGSDGGGSIRQPAHVCGICGLKPTGGRLTMQGHWLASNWPADWAQPGPMARHVDDLYLALQALESPRPERPVYGEFPSGVQDPRRIASSTLRVGFYEELPGLPVVPAIRRGVKLAIAALQDAGVQIMPFTIPAAESMWECFQVLLYAEGLRDMRRQLRGSEVDARVRQFLQIAQLPNSLRPLIAWGADRIGQPRVAKTLRLLRRSVLSADAYCQWTHRMHALRITMSRAMERQELDAILCPPHPVPAWPHDHFYANDAMQYTAIFNLLAMPAGVVPVSHVQPAEANSWPTSRDWIERALQAADQDSAGLPVGVQVVGRWWREDVVLHLMKIVEMAVRASGEFPDRWPTTRL